MNLDIKEIAATGIATAGLIIACSIFLQMLTTKYISVFERYRVLTGEYRNGSEQARRDSLEEQITLYYHRSHLLRRATCWLLSAEYVFVVTILSTTLSVVFPRVNGLKYLSGASLTIGLLIICVGAALDMAENRLSRLVIDSEIKDFPHLPRKQASASNRTDAPVPEASR